ncbi:unnamed protein product [Callosobruchus maculatus]|uniref:Uncharacterized protein n=1 Tax=Callosobruchus maculatus TaxID=64391 RepID=A0A653DQI3_CALMS|nr:unnamed protein product [Callosobruchus maculatus]
MRKARRIIRREKAELRILAEMKRMSDLAFDELRNSESDEPSPEVVDLDLFIDFLKGRGKQPLRYKRVNLPHGVIKRLPKRVPSPSRIITKELRVNICRLTKKEIEEKTSKKNRAKLASESLNRSKSSKKSCESDLNGNKVASKGKPDDNDSDLENTNQRNTDHESNQRATPDTNQLDKRTPLVLLHNVAARSVLANVPGLNDFHLMQPQNVDQIINVVQVPGAKTQMQTTSQTSTPVTAHIQRIGQPRPSEQKPENSTPVSTNISNVVATSTSTGHTTTKTQPSTLINILSQQVIRPANIVPCGSAITGNSNGHTSNTNTTSSGNNSNSTCSSGNSSSTTTPTRRPPFINILSQQIIRPTQASKGAPNNGAYTVTETVLVWGAKIRNSD